MEGPFALGMSYPDIQGHVSDMYDLERRSDYLSQITSRTLPESEAGRAQPLEALYPAVYIEAVHFMVGRNGGIVSEAMYHRPTNRVDGHKELLGLSVGKDRLLHAFPLPDTRLLLRLLSLQRRLGTHG